MKVDRVSVFRGDVYPNEYFNHYKNAKKIKFEDPLYIAMDANYKPLHPNHLRELPLAQWKSLAAEEPWLEWDSSQKNSSLGLPEQPSDFSRAWPTLMRLSLYFAALTSARETF